MIVIVSLLLALCVTVDYATNETVVNNDTPLDIPSNVTVMDSNNDPYDGIVERDNRVYVDKSKSVRPKKKKVKKDPVVTITSKPSCGCGYGYYWHTMTFKDYCPHCHHKNCLRNVHKWPARYEQELTCTVCGADYCGCCGKEKYSWSHYYLTKGDGG